MRICFYADMSGHPNWRDVFEKVEFYRLDIRLLRELGHEVVLAGGPRYIDPRADAYFCWWWGHALLPLAFGKVRNKPVLVTGAFDYSTCRKEMPGLCYLDRPWWQRVLLRSVLRLAHRNLFISRFEFDEVVSNLTVRNPVLAPLAIDTEYYSPLPEATPPEDYFFTISWTSRSNVIRKGLIATIDAFAEVARVRPATRLLVAGKPGDHQQALEAQVARLGLEGRVQFLGMVDDDCKLAHYRRCLAYVQPTLHEGFGHAIAEAIACGARVVASPRGAVPEVAGDHAIWVDPSDIASIRDGMLAVAEQPWCQDEVAPRHAWIAAQYPIARRREILRDVLEGVNIQAAPATESLS